MHRALIVLFLAALPQAAAAQALTPMRQDFATYADRFAIRLTAINPYENARRFTVTVLNDDWSAAEAKPLTPEIVVGPGAQRPFLITGAAKAAAQTIRVCVTSDPVAAKDGSSIRGQVCGKYRIFSRRL